MQLPMKIRDKKVCGLYLDKGEEKGKIAMYTMLGLEDLGGMDAFPRGSNLNKDTLFSYSMCLIHLYQLQCLFNGLFRIIA